MSEFYDHYHRWEPLAEFHFNLNDSEDEFDDDNFLYCLCSRAYIRDGVKNYVDKEDGSESDMEVVRDSGSQEWEDQSHVHFSLDTSYKVKCEKDEGASCYCSASHTDNCCSTDEHDAAQIHGKSHALQPSDSGADLTYQDCNSENTNADKLEHMEQDCPQLTEEDYLTEVTWDKFWAVNGERLIWASWIKKYSDYINPAYMDDNSEFIDGKNISKQKSVDEIYKESERNEDDDIRERKFSYDSKVNPYKKGHSQNQTEKLDKGDSKDESWLPPRRRSCSEHERIVSPRTLAATDSMTNVTKITLSSYDVTSSHVTSESSATDDYSVSSSNSDDQSNDQTRIANIENAEPTSVDDMDTDQYWQFLWKKHFGEQYDMHYANYIESHNDQDNKLPIINIEPTTPKEIEIKNTVLEIKDIQEKVLDIECENSEGNSQELPTVIEVQAQVEEMKLQEPIPKSKKRGKKKSNKYLGSVGVLLQNLLKDEVIEDNNKDIEITDAAENDGDNKNQQKTENSVTENSVENKSVDLQQSASNTNFTSYSYDDGDDDPPEETHVNLKRSHEIEDQEEGASEKIKATFEIMGFSIEDNKIPKGQMVYRKKLARLRPPRYKNTKRFGVPKKTYFDEDGNPIQAEQSKDSQDEREMQTGDDLFCPDFKSEALRLLNTLSENKTEEVTNKDQNDQTQTSESEIAIGERNIHIDNVEEENKNRIQIEDMNVDTNESASVSVDVNKDAHKSLDVTENSSQSACSDSLIRNNNGSEDMNVDDTAKLNYSTDKMAIENKSIEKDVVTEHDSKLEHMNVDLNNSDSNKLGLLGEFIENSTEEAIDKEHTNKSTNEIDERSNDFHKYDVENKVESSLSDESKALEASKVPLPDDLDQSSDETKPEAVENAVIQSVESTKRRRRQKRFAKLDEEELSNVPIELRDDPKMMKYWKKRHSLFHRFDSGIRLDRESWFSVTPESVARHIARRHDNPGTVLDAFCGAGGNSIQFAITAKKVIAVDIDPAKVEMARHNATVYGVADRIQFIVGDFFELASTLQADTVFLSPPWGGPDYSNNAQYDIETMLEPRPASELMSVARTISSNISLYLPRNTRPDQILSLAKEVGGSVEVEQSYLDKRFVAITAYYY